MAKKSKSLRLDESDEVLFAQAAKATDEDDPSAWMRRTLRREARRDIARAKKEKAK
jgi:hypothetical protein